MSVPPLRTGVLACITAATGALGVAAVLSAASASAAPTDDYFFAPDTSTFDPASALGYPPLVDVLQGQETWTLPGLPVNNDYNLYGTDTQTTFGSFTNNDLLTDGYGYSETTPGPNFEATPSGSEVDLMNFGGGFENEWINVPANMIGNGAAPGVSDLLITPFGNFELYGTYFADFATPIS